LFHIENESFCIRVGEMKSSVKPEDVKVFKKPTDGKY